MFRGGNAHKTIKTLLRGYKLELAANPSRSTIFSKLPTYIQSSFVDIYNVAQ